MPLPFKKKKISLNLPFIPSLLPSTLPTGTSHAVPMAASKINPFGGLTHRPVLLAREKIQGGGESGWRGMHSHQGLLFFLLGLSV